MGSFKISEIGRVFQEMRKEKGWSQKDLASKANVSLHKVKEYERAGGPMPSLETTYKVARALGYDLRLTRREEKKRCRRKS
jgi:transcriptional regulator with XRE-family HTH domain